MSWCFALFCLGWSRWRRRELGSGCFWFASSYVGGRSWSSFRVEVVDDELDKMQNKKTQKARGLVEGCECECV